MIENRHLRFFSTLWKPPKEVFFKHSGHFIGHVIHIQSPEEAEEKNKVRALLNDWSTGIAMSGIFADGFTIYLRDSEPEVSTKSRIHIDYEQLIKFPDLRIGDIVNATSLVNDRGQMEFASLQFKRGGGASR